MSSDKNLQTALLYFDRLSKQDYKGAWELCTDDFHLVNMLMIDGKVQSWNKEAYEEICRRSMSVFPKGMTQEITGTTSENDRVAIECTGVAEFAKGGHYNNNYHFLFRFRDGKIFEVKEYLDSAYGLRTLAKVLTEEGIAKDSAGGINFNLTGL